jgi:hypothetical protein
MLQDHLDDKFYSHIPIHDKGISMTNHIAGLKPSKDNKNLGVNKHTKSHDVVVQPRPKKTYADWIKNVKEKVDQTNDNNLILKFQIDKLRR